MLFAASRLAHAEPSGDGSHLSSLPINAENPESSIPTAQQQMQNPLEFGYLLQDMLADAISAEKKKDYYHAARYYRALATAVPKRAYAFGKLCEALQNLGERENAEKACRAALTREDVTSAEFERFVYLMLSKQEPLSTEELKELDGVIDHLSKTPESAVLAANFRCQVGLRIQSTLMLEQCTAVLAKAQPDAPATLSFQWALALQNHDKDSARRLIARARSAGMSRDGLRQMETATRSEFGIDRAAVAMWSFGGALLLGIALLATHRFRLLQRRAAG